MALCRGWNVAQRGARRGTTGRMSPFVGLQRGQTRKKYASARAKFGRFVPANAQGAAGVKAGLFAALRGAVAGLVCGLPSESVLKHRFGTRGTRAGHVPFSRVSRKKASSHAAFRAAGHAGHAKNINVEKKQKNTGRKKGAKRPVPGHPDTPPACAMPRPFPWRSCSACNACVPQTLQGRGSDSGR